MSDDRLDRIENKIDKVVDHIGSIDSTLAAQHVSLKEHMRRSDALEAKVQPIERHVAMVSGALKMLGLIALIASIAEGLISVLNYIRK